MPTNWYLFFATALIPLVVGFFWYGNMGFGKKWMKVNGFTEESLAGANMGLIFCLLYTSPSPRDRQKSRMPSSA